MCDLYSWGVMLYEDPPHNLHPGDILFLTDAEAKTLLTPYVSWSDTVGHSAIASYYQIPDTSFEHRESQSVVPIALAKEIAKGHCTQLAGHSYIDGATSWRFDVPTISPDYMARETKYAIASAALPTTHPHWSTFRTHLRRAFHNIRNLRPLPPTTKEAMVGRILTVIECLPVETRVEYTIPRIISPLLSVDDGNFLASFEMPWWILRKIKDSIAAQSRRLR